MALLDNSEVIKQYYNAVEEICKNPFKFFKMQMEKPEMPSMYLKYFGRLVVYSSTIIKLLKALEVKKSFNQISDERYTTYKANLQARLKTIQEHEIYTSNKRSANRKEATN
jgi:hypothetical protein